MKRTSIKDIAQVVGVSAATVSLVLTGKGKDGRVSKEMSAKILQVAKDMNYQPNRLARSLQSGRSQTIGLLVADIVNPFFASLAFHIQEEMGKAGYAVIIMNTDESNLQMEKMIDLLQCRQVDGYIIVPAESGESCIRQMVDARIPLVLIDRYYPGIETYNVLIDNYQASYKATRHLIGQGCRKIGLLIYDNIQPHMRERRAGYIDALTEAGLFDAGYMKEVQYKNMTESIKEAMYSLLDDRNAVDGILFATNTITLNGLKQLFRMKVRIPEDVQVVCFDKSDVFDFLPVAIPYIQQPIKEMARVASGLLLAQLDNIPDKEPSVHKLYADLII